MTAGAETTPRGPYAARVSTSVSQQRDILRLAVPAFLALVAEPLFLLADSAIVGHLGTAQLAGLGVASAALVTAADLFVFLAYGTTSVVARQARRRLPSARRSAPGSTASGWPLALGVPTGRAVAVFAGRSAGCSAPRRRPAQAVTYLRISAAGIPAMLVVLAVTGVLRGLQDTRTPLLDARSRLRRQHVLNLILVYGLGLGHRRFRTRAPSLAQTGMAADARTPWSPAGPARWRRACDRTPGGCGRDGRPAAAGPHGRPAGRVRRHHLGGRRAGRRAGGRLPGVGDSVELPRVRPRCPRHRRGGPDRNVPCRLPLSFRLRIAERPIDGFMAMQESTLILRGTSSARC